MYNDYSALVFIEMSVYYSRLTPIFFCHIYTACSSDRPNVQQFVRLFNYNE